MQQVNQNGLRKRYTWRESKTVIFFKLSLDQFKVVAKRNKTSGGAGFNSNTDNLLSGIENSSAGRVVVQKNADWKIPKNIHHYNESRNDVENEKCINEYSSLQPSIGEFHRPSSTDVIPEKQGKKTDPR